MSFTAAIELWLCVIGAYFALTRALDRRMTRINRRQLVEGERLELR